MKHEQVIIRDSAFSTLWDELYALFISVYVSWRFKSRRMHLTRENTLDVGSKRERGCAASILFSLLFSCLRRECSLSAIYTALFDRLNYR